MIYRTDLNKGKFYDASQTRSFCERMLHAAQDYCRKSSDTDEAYSDFAANEEFLGMTATNVKKFVAVDMGTMNQNIADEHRKMIQDQEAMIECFETTVDSDPNAIIDYDALEKINADLKGQHSSFGAIAGDVDGIINDLDMLVGEEYGKFPRPNRGNVDDKFVTLCGSDNADGYIKECQNKLLKFDAEMTDYIGKNDTAAFLEDVTAKTSKAAGVFNSYGADAAPVIKAPQNFKVVKDAGVNNNAQVQAANQPAGKTDQRVITKNSPFYDINHYGADHTDNGSGWKVFNMDNNLFTVFPLAFSFFREVADNRDEDLYRHLKNKRDSWDKYGENGEYIEDDDTLIEDLLWNDTEVGIHRFLKGINTADAAATNIIFDQMQYCNDDTFKQLLGFSRRGKDGELNNRFLAADFRAETEKGISLYDTGAINALVQEKAALYKENEDDFKSKYGDVRLLNSDGTYNLYALELIRKDIIASDGVGRVIQDYDVSLDGSIINGLDVGTGSRDAKGTLSLINRISLYCDNHNMNMTSRSLNKGVIIPDNSEISNALANGESVVFTANDFDLEVDGNAVHSDGEKQLVVSGIENGKLVVSYRGKKCFFDPKAQSNNTAAQDFYAVKVTPEAADKTVPLGANPFYDNRLWDEHFEGKDIDFGEAGNVTRFPRFENLSTFAIEHKLPGLENIHVGGRGKNVLKDSLSDMANRGSLDVNRVLLLADAYKDDPNAFKQKYGYDLYDSKGNINVEYIMLDYYQNYGRHMTVDLNTEEGVERLVNVYKTSWEKNKESYKTFFGKDFNSVSPEEFDADCRAFVQQIKKDNTKNGQCVVDVSEEDREYYKESVQSENNKFEQYCKAHGDNLKLRDMNGLSTQDRLKNVKNPDFNTRREAMLHDKMPTAGEIKKAKDDGYKLYFACADPYYLEDEKGNTGVISVGEARSKEMEILDVKEIKGSDGVLREKLLVSCNGKQYYYDAIAHSKDCDNFYAMKVKAGKAAKK